MPRIEFPKFLGRGHRAEITPVLDKTAKIKDIAINASKIWFDRRIKDNDRKSRYMVAAQELLNLLNPDFLKNPKFYNDLSPDTHIRVLQLLSEFVPTVKSEEFQSSRTHRVVVNYLVGLIDHKGFISAEQNGVDSTPMDDINSAVCRIRSESRMPQYYLDDIFGENVGRPPERDKRGDNESRVISLDHYRKVVKAPGEQRKQKQR